MPEIYLLACEALKICDKAESKIIPIEARNLPRGEDDNKEPKDVRDAIAHIKEQYNAAKELGASENNIIIRISLDDQLSLVWGLSRN